MFIYCLVKTRDIMKLFTSVYELQQQRDNMKLLQFIKKYYNKIVFYIKMYIKRSILKYYFNIVITFIEFIICNKRTLNFLL